MKIPLALALPLLVAARPQDFSADKAFRALRAESPEARSRAAVELGRHPEVGFAGSSALSAQFARESEIPVRQQIVRALSAYAPKSDDAVKTLVAALDKDPARAVRLEAAELLKKLASRAAPVTEGIVRAWSNEVEPEVLQLTTDILLELIPFGASRACRTAAAEALAASSSRRRAQALRLLGAAGSLTSREISALQKIALDDADPDVRFAAELALASGLNQPERRTELMARGSALLSRKVRSRRPDTKGNVFPVEPYMLLIRMRDTLASKRSEAARQCADHVAYLGDWREALLLEATQNLIKDAEPHVRAAAARASAVLAYDAYEDCIELRELFRDSAPLVRAAAAKSYSIYEEEISLPAVGQLASLSVADPFHECRAAADRTLSICAKASLTSAMKGKPRTRREAEEFLRRSTFENALAESYAGRLKSTDVAVRARAAQRLADLGPAAASAIPALLEALENPAAMVRVSALRALLSIRELPQDLAGKLDRSLRDRDPRVRSLAAKVRERMSEQMAASRPSIATEPESRPAPELKPQTSPDLAERLLQAAQWRSGRGDVLMTIEDLEITILVRIAATMAPEALVLEAQEFTKRVFATAPELKSLILRVEEKSGTLQLATRLTRAEESKHGEILATAGRQARELNEEARPKDAAPPEKPAPELEVLAARLAGLIEGDGEATDPFVKVENGKLVLRLQLTEPSFEREMAYPEAALLCIKLFDRTPELTSIQVRIYSSSQAELLRAEVTAERALVFRHLVGDVLARRAASDWWLQMSGAAKAPK